MFSFKSIDYASIVVGQYFACPIDKSVTWMLRLGPFAANPERGIGGFKSDAEHLLMFPLGENDAPHIVTSDLIPDDFRRNGYKVLAANTEEISPGIQLPSLIQASRTKGNLYISEDGTPLVFASYRAADETSDTCFVDLSSGMCRRDDQFFTLCFDSWSLMFGENSPIYRRRDGRVVEP